MGEQCVTALHMTPNLNRILLTALAVECITDLNLTVHFPATPLKMFMEQTVTNQSQLAYSFPNQAAITVEQQYLPK